MNGRFLKPFIQEIDTASITPECVEQQLLSMQLGYISHCFIVKGLADDYDIFFKANFDEFSEETIEKAEVHALKHIANPEYLTGEIMKTMSREVQQCTQAMLMINNKREELEAQQDKAAVMKRNISWLKDLQKKMEDEKAASASSTMAKINGGVKGAQG